MFGSVEKSAGTMRRCADPQEMIVGFERKNDADLCTERFMNQGCWKKNTAGLFEKLFADLNVLTCVKYCKITGYDLYS